MSEIIDISGFKCTNHIPSKKVIVSGVFDIHNPCTWCENRENIGGRGPIFHYVEYGHWEFPFIAEANCHNFSLIHTEETIVIEQTAWDKAKQIHEQRNKIATLGIQYSHQWVAYDFNDDAVKFNFSKEDDTIIYPNQFTAEQFFEETSRLRSEFFSLKMELKRTKIHIQKEWNVQTTQIENWIKHSSQQMGILSKQIDELETNKESLSVRTVSRWAMGGVTGSAAWDSLKWTKDIIFELFN